MTYSSEALKAFTLLPLAFMWPRWMPMPASKMKVRESMAAYDAGFWALTCSPWRIPCATPLMARLKPTDWLLLVPSPKREYDELLPLL